VRFQDHELDQECGSAVIGSARQREREGAQPPVPSGDYQAACHHCRESADQQQHDVHPVIWLAARRMANHEETGNSCRAGANADEYDQVPAPLQE
jgi:hypothetical protein